MVLPFGSTNPFTLEKGNSISYATISGHVPLEKDENLFLILYQDNDRDEPALISLELTIIQGSPYGRCLEYVHLRISPRHQCIPELTPRYISESLEEDLTDFLEESRNRATARRKIEKRPSSKRSKIQEVSKNFGERIPRTSEDIQEEIISSSQEISEKYEEEWVAKENWARAAMNWLMETFPIDDDDDVPKEKGSTPATSASKKKTNKKPSKKNKAKRAQVKAKSMETKPKRRIELAPATAEKSTRPKATPKRAPKTEILGNMEIKTADESLYNAINSGLGIESITFNIEDNEDVTYDSQDFNLTVRKLSTGDTKIATDIPEILKFAKTVNVMEIEYKPVGADEIISADTEKPVIQKKQFLI